MCMYIDHALCTLAECFTSKFTLCQDFLLHFNAWHLCKHVGGLVCCGNLGLSPKIVVTAFFHFSGFSLCVCTCTCACIQCIVIYRYLDAVNFVYVFREECLY